MASGQQRGGVAVLTKEAVVRVEVCAVTDQKTLLVQAASLSWAYVLAEFARGAPEPRRVTCGTERMTVRYMKQ
jgi:hypothetical protein